MYQKSWYFRYFRKCHDIYEPCSVPTIF